MAERRSRISRSEIVGCMGEHVLKTITQDEGGVVVSEEVENVCGDKRG
jgi:hypothetical protein